MNEIFEVDRRSFLSTIFVLVFEIIEPTDKERRIAINQKKLKDGYNFRANTPARRTMNKIYAPLTAPRVKNKGG